MTRDEAIQRIRPHIESQIMPDSPLKAQDIVDALAALGVLKLDEPWFPVVMMKTAYGKMGTTGPSEVVVYWTDIEDKLLQHGYMLVKFA